MLRPHDVTAIVLNYRRPWNIPTIVRSLVNTGFRRVIIGDCRDFDDPFGDSCLLEAQLFDDVDVVQCVFSGADGCNPRSGARYMLSDCCDTEYVFYQDDDYEVTELGVRRLLAATKGYEAVAQLPVWTPEIKSTDSLPFVNIGYGSIMRVDLVEAAIRILATVFHDDLLELSHNADRCVMSLLGKWTSIPATDKCLVRLSNPDGSLSETDEHAIHLEDGYAARVMPMVGKCLDLKRRIELLLSSYGYRDLMDYMSRTDCGQSAPVSLASIISTLESDTPATSSD